MTVLGRYYLVNYVIIIRSSLILFYIRLWKTGLRYERYNFYARSGYQC